MGSAENANYVFLYNVGKQMFLNRGGNWGTEAVLSDVGMEFEVISGDDKTSASNTSTSLAGRYGFHSQFTGEGGLTPYLTYADGTGDFSTFSSEDDYDYYMDQGGQAFTLTEATYNGKTVYSISCSATYSSTTSTYYMCAGKASGSTSAADEDVCVSGYSTLPTDGTGYWILVTVKEREEYIKSLSDTTVEQAPATFLMYDNDFARRSTDIKYWKQADGTALTNSNNVVKTPPSTSSTTTYFVGAGVADASASKGTCGKCSAHIHGSSGKIYQTIDDLPAIGWYEIHANVFCTTAGAAKMYAAVGDATSGPTTLKTEYIEKDVLTLSSRPSSYVNAYDELNKNITQSGVETYNYQVVARVFVGAKEDGTTPESLTMGVVVSNGDNTTWTAADNFQIYFIGQSGQSIYLDEDQETVDDMNAQISNETTSTVYIHRSMTANKWNSLILPFAMTHNDIVNAFGVGTYVCEFKGATDEANPTTLYFDAVASIKSNTPYIVKPTLGEPTRSIAAEKVKSGVTTTLEKYSYYTIHKTFCFNGNEDAEDNKFPETIDGATGKENYSDAADNLTFHGTYVKKLSQIPAESYVIYAGDTDVSGSEGKWVRNSVVSHSRAFRAWLELTGTSTTPAATEAKFCIGGIIDDDDQPTAIKGLSRSARQTVDNCIYTIYGQRVATDASQLGQLPSGLYIVGGKKLLVK